MLISPRFGLFSTKFAVGVFDETCCKIYQTRQQKFVWGETETGEKRGGWLIRVSGGKLVADHAN